MYYIKSKSRAHAKSCRLRKLYRMLNNKLPIVIWLSQTRFICLYLRHKHQRKNLTLAGKMAATFSLEILNI
jgi:hypothetical protein